MQPERAAVVAIGRGANEIVRDISRSDIQIWIDHSNFTPGLRLNPVHGSADIRSVTIRAAEQEPGAQNREQQRHRPFESAALARLAGRLRFTVHRTAVLLISGFASRFNFRGVATEEFAEAESIGQAGGNGIFEERRL